MAQSLSKIYVHIIFSTKNRATFLKSDSLRKSLYAFMFGICRKLDSPAIIIGGISDHVHLICCLSRIRTISEVVRELKRASTKWIKNKYQGLKLFHWQNGYGSFSISPAHLKLVREYIEKQIEHHRGISFKEEFRKIVEKYNIKYDERYVWD